MEILNFRIANQSSGVTPITDFVGGMEKWFPGFFPCLAKVTREQSRSRQDDWLWPRGVENQEGQVKPLTDSLLIVFYVHFSTFVFTIKMRRRRSGEWIDCWLARVPFPDSRWLILLWHLSLFRCIPLDWSTIMYQRRCKSTFQKSRREIDF